MSGSTGGRPTARRRRIAENQTIGVPPEIHAVDVAGTQGVRSDAVPPGGNGCDENPAHPLGVVCGWRFVMRFAICDSQFVDTWVVNDYSKGRSEGRDCERSPSGTLSNWFGSHHFGPVLDRFQASCSRQRRFWQWIEGDRALGQDELGLWCVSIDRRDVTDVPFDTTAWGLRLHTFSSWGW